MRAGDIVLVPFPFTDLQGSKNRPAIVLINSENDVVVSFLTTQLKWRGQFDVELNPTTENGLKRISIIRLDKITTIDKDLIIGRIGSVSKHEREKIKASLIELFKNLD